MTTLYMVTGLGNPKWLSNCINNFVEQDFSDKHLVIVENGDGIAACDCISSSKITVLRSERGVTDYMNVGIKWLRQNANSEDWFCKCDSDDLYCADYLFSITEAIEAGADYAGRCDLYVKTMHNKLWFQNRMIRGFCDEVPHGPTICARISTSFGFPYVGRWAEDYKYCVQMHAAGKKFYSLAPEGMCYMRYANNDHAWPCNDDELLQTEAEYVDLGEWNESSLDIVNGITPRPEGTLIKKQRFDGNKSMPYRVLLESLDGEMQQAIKEGPNAIAKLYNSRNANIS